MAKKRHSGSKLRKKQERRRGLFFPPKNKEIAKIIMIDSHEDAKKSVKELKELLDKGKISIDDSIEYVNCAEQRAKAQLKRKNLSAKERREMKKVAEIYNDFKKRLKKAKKIIGLR